MAKNNKEIERWFLPRYSLLPKLENGREIVQGYLRGKSTVRVRLEIMPDGEKRADLTIKGKKKGISRTEIVIPLPYFLARILLYFRVLPLIQKTRYLLPSGSQHPWEIDVFHGSNEGLIKVEIEFESENEKLPSPLPEWIYTEVTGDDAYGNKHLAKNPFCNWPEEKKMLGR